MKKISSILLIFVMVFAMSITASAWSSSDWWSNVASDEIISGAPSTGAASHKDYIVLYDTVEQTYYYLAQTGTAYSVKFYINATNGLITMTNNNLNTFNVYKYDSSSGWVQQADSTGTKNLTSYTLPDCLFVSSVDAQIFIDEVQLEYSNGNLTVGGEVLRKITSVSFTPPNKTLYTVGDTFDATGITVTAFYNDGTSKDVTNDAVITVPDLSKTGMNIEGKINYDIWSYTFTVNVSDETIVDPGEGEDLSNSGLLGGIKDFFSDLFDGLLDLSDFLWEIIYKIGDLLKSLYETLLKLPQVITSIDELFGEESAIFDFLDSIFPEDNENAQNCKFIVLLVFSFGLFMFFYGLIKKFLLK